MKLVKNKEYLSMYRAAKEREAIWQGLCMFLQQEIPEESCVLDLGCGYCNFINNIKAKRKIATDINIGFKEFAKKDVEFIDSSCTDLSKIKTRAVDVAFASNLLEHLGEEELKDTLKEVQRVLKSKGKLILIQPNFYYCYREYFHDCTHKTIFTHVGLCDFLSSNGFKIKEVVPRLLPLSMQSKYGGFHMPDFLTSRYLVYLYLKQPFKLFAKQMYVVAVA